MADKAQVTLGGVPLAATTGVAWTFQAGVQPYTTVFTAHERHWDQLKTVIGQPLDLKISDPRDRTTVVRDVYILHEAPSDAPHRVSFVVADKRWKWAYKLVVHDFNMPRKTGDRTAFGEVPVELQTVVDVYDYLPYSLDDGKRWTAKRAVESVLADLEPGAFEVDEFPIEGDGEDGQFTLQGITLRDQGDVALARLLSYVPGADVWVDSEGKVRVIDATNLQATEEYAKRLPALQRIGEVPRWIDRKRIRPSRVVAHYQREVELLFEYDDDYSGGTTAPPSRNAPYLDNVLPTVDPSTDITEFDPERGEVVTKSVPPGTWVQVSAWLQAMDADRPEGSAPWTFETIRKHWLKGDLEGVLGARGLDLDATGNVAMRVAALRQHFRQTFRIQRRYMERIRSLRAVRVALLDPVTGARAPAAVWGQACIIPAHKWHMTQRGTSDIDRQKVYRNVDYLPTIGNTIEFPPGPTSVNILDEELGIFRLEWLASPYGTVESFVPCHLVDSSNAPRVVMRDLSQQDVEPMGAGIQIESGTNGIFLRNTMRYRVMLTVVPASPNSAAQFHRHEVAAGEVADVFRQEFRIQEGEGPELHVFVPPGEATARFAWQDDNLARQTLVDLLGLVVDNPDTPQIEGQIEGADLPGFEPCNQGRELASHALSLAAELYAGFADGLQGAAVTVPPSDGVKLVGNMSGATLRVGTAPSAKVDVVHQFPGRQRALSRFALLPDSARAILLGIVPFRE